MADDETKKRMAETTELLGGLQSVLAEFAATVREVQSIVTFGTHPDLTALDDDLDITYRGQI